MIKCYKFHHHPIHALLQELIGLGAKTVVVPGNFPIGCNPGYLAKFQTKNTAQYDSMGCLRWPNDLTKLHNRELRVELAELGRRHPASPSSTPTTTPPPWTSPPTPASTVLNLVPSSRL
jgi:hypothetical protein